MTATTATTNPLAALFAEADRIGNKYQSQEEYEARTKNGVYENEWYESLSDED